MCHTVICFIDMEHGEAVRRGAPCAASAGQGARLHEAYCADLQRRLEECSGAVCTIRRYDEVTQEWLDATGAEALVLGGNVTDWDQYEEVALEPLREIVRAASLPILGLCGGLQFIALAHGVTVAPMRDLEADEGDVGGGFAVGYFKEWGYTPVQILRSDPLFDGFDVPVFLEAHYCEVKSVPEGFEVLASTGTCRIQALHRSGTMVYGTQFHPEAYISHPSDHHNCLIQRIYPAGYPQLVPDGRRLLVNFFRAAHVLE